MNETRGFWALIVTQCQGAINDHAFKNLILLVALHAATTPDLRNWYSSIIPALFIVPFLIFSLPAGALADRLSKRTVLLTAKALEIVIMGLGLLAFTTGSIWPPIAILFLMGTQSAFFGPSKYGIVPELVPEKKLSWANGIMELTTFAAIILGTFFGTLLMQSFGSNLPLAMLPLIVFSILGTIAATRLPDLPAANPTKPISFNPIGELLPQIAQARTDQVLWLAVMGNTYFWFLAGLMFTNIPVFGLDVLGLPDVKMGTLMVALAFGIGVGSWMAGHLSGPKIEYGLIPLGAIFISIFAVDLSWYVTGYAHALLALTLLGFGGGFFSVPINALIQHRPDARSKGGVQGMTYFLSNVGVILASAVFYLLTVVLKCSSSQVFFVGAAMTVVATSYAVWLLPDSLLRLVLWILTHTIYRMKVVGRDNIPDKGGALFVANHMSFVDALLVTASTDRFVRFIMAKEYYDLPLINPLARMMHVIPIAGNMGLKALLGSLREAGRSIQEGDVVCIFAEGEMTRTGQMLPFRRGFEKIMRNVQAPIIPIHLDRVWGSIFSFQGGRFFWKWPRRLLDPITVSFGPPLPASSTAQQLRQAVMELGTEAFALRKSEMQPLHREFMAEVGRHPRQFAMADGQNSWVTYREVLIKAIVIADKLGPSWKDQEMIGVLMPPSVAGAALNIAIMLTGRVPVNLNFTAAQSSVESAIKQCGIKTIVSAKAFMERIKITLPFPPTLMEEMAATVTAADKVRAMIRALFFPGRWIERSLGSTRDWTMDDIATIIFSSGSTGEPKGVMLSHYNIFANCEGVAQVLKIVPEDRIMGSLPFFHSFGFTGTLWCPLLKGFGAIYHPNPMDSRVIGALVATYNATLLVSTPTFLQAYMRRVPPEQFGSLRITLVGAEKLTERVATAFEDRFGIRPLECYGCTELSPAVTINVPGFRAGGFYQVGAKRGRIGHPLPGVSVRIVDPDTRAPVPIGQSGLLLVKGPNVMLGYLGRPDLTETALKEGWYCTGDMAAIDEDGFVTITDRLSRFAKIAGEMVPLMKIEEELQRLAGATNQVFAVASIPDEKKGEKLVVLHTLSPEAIKSVTDRLAGCGLPNLWIPRPDAFKAIEAIPVLGTGKMDLRRIKEIALGGVAAG